MNAFFSFNLAMVYIPECKQQQRAMKYNTRSVRVRLFNRLTQKPLFENFTASIVDLMVANIRLLTPLTRRQ
jgi:hypothetical protein